VVTVDFGNFDPHEAPHISIFRTDHLWVRLPILYDEQEKEMRHLPEMDKPS